MAKKTSKGDAVTQRMFRDPSGQEHMFDKSLQEEAEARAQQPVECLGMRFPNEEARRSHFMDRLRVKLKDTEFRKIEGFPIGTDEDILALSDPPYYTACPNPFLDEFIRTFGKPYSAAEQYTREPMAVDVSEGKTDQLYKAHGYHTKVPHLAIVPSLLHYTSPGDVVLDGFSGSGMTGVAARWCGVAPKEYRSTLESQWENSDVRPCWGERSVVLSDLGVAPAFISANYNMPFPLEEFHDAASALLRDLKQKYGWMYETLHTDGRSRGTINFTVWSEVFSCPECHAEIVFFKEGFDVKTKSVRDSFPCPKCKAGLTKNQLDRMMASQLDPVLKKRIQCIKRVPMLINYTVAGETYEKLLDDNDRDVIQKASELPFPSAFPVDRMMHAPESEECWGDKYRSGTASFGYVHHIFLPRPVQALAFLWEKALSAKSARLRNAMLFFVEQAISGMSVLNRYGPSHFSQVNRALSGVYYIASLISEVSPWYILEGKLARLTTAMKPLTKKGSRTIISTGSCTQIRLPDDCVDYIFTDPPFGNSLAYSELNFVVESFHRVFTNSKLEAIVSPFQEKRLVEYQRLMQGCFAAYYRVLKPGRWMTVVFHNSQNSVWNAIQESLQAAGFVVADVRVLDKQQGSFNQGIAAGSVKQDLVISAYKPEGGFAARFQLKAGTEEGLWEFVRSHLHHLPVFVSKGGEAETVAERQNYLLFDRMVAFHVQRGVSIPLNAANFYSGLGNRFMERDGMYFLPDQVAEYDRNRAKVTRLRQLQLFVTDETSAIQWIRQQLTEKPQTFKELQPQFMKEVAGWEKHEQPLELQDLLRQNFICYDGDGQVPNPIHAYLSSNFKELRNLSKADAGLREKATDRWYVPDPHKAGDLEKLRERTLLAEFEEYRSSKQRSLKVFRTEAVRAGFKAAYDRQDYKTIVEVAAKLPETVLQEDEKLLMYYDVATMRMGDEGKDKLFQ